VYGYKFSKDGDELDKEHDKKHSKFVELYW